MLGFTLVIATICVWFVPRSVENFSNYAWADSFPVLALAGLIGVRLWDSKETEALTYLASGTYIFGMLSSAAFVALV